ncbi:unnamed protein product, partial [Ectocarpus sp. 4 AP-2014]
GTGKFARQVVQCESWSMTCSTSIGLIASFDRYSTATTYFLRRYLALRELACLFPCVPAVARLGEYGPLSRRGGRCRTGNESEARLPSISDGTKARQTQQELVRLYTLDCVQRSRRRMELTQVQAQRDANYVKGDMYME